MYLPRIGNGGVYNNWIPPFLFSLASSLSVYLSTWNNYIRLADQVDSLYNVNNGENFFDFIVVGGGSAGAIVANRLSMNYKVLLLEAGGDPHPSQSVPSFATMFLNKPEIDWMHKTTPQSNSSLAMNHRQAIWNQGRSLGGTSNINYMTESRGSPMDYDAWASITGDDAWNYENLLPSFKKHEDFVGQWSEGNVHGSGGEMRIEVPSYTLTGMGFYFIKAGQELGYIQDDLNGRFTEGFDYVYSPIKNGRRHETYKAFLQPIFGRSNLVIRRFSHVNKIFFHGDDNEAFAVEYDRYGVRNYAFASNEIILSAGAVKSPQILMLSGIGPKQQLEQLGIPTKKDLPVGQNVQDHLGTCLSPFLMDAPLSFMYERDFNSLTTADYTRDGSGPFSNIGTNAQAFIASSKTKSPNSTLNWPNIQLLFVGAGFDSNFPEILSGAFNIRKDIASQYYNHALGFDGFSIIVSNSRPQARGEITLVSSDPYAAPRIEPNYLNNNHDMEVTLEGVYKALELVENTTIFQTLGARFTNIVFPGCENFTFRSDEYFKCYIRHYSFSLHDISGSCSMGRQDSPNAVVDSELKVIGTRKLRVIDASVIPQIPVGNTNAVANMIGEKGADLILKEWGSQENSTTNKPDDVQENTPSIDGPSLSTTPSKEDDRFGNFNPAWQIPPPQPEPDYDHKPVEVPPS